MQHKISVIVPVYNVEEYLEVCISSIINQTYQELEIILIDDGSTDRSGILCDEIKQRDERILVYHKTNGGLSSARNMGIELASGDLLAFVDSDDVLSVHMLQLLYQHMQEQDADMVLCDYCRIYDIKDVVPTTDKDSEVLLLTGNELSNMIYSKEYCIIVPVAWNKLYRRELFDQIRYPLGRYHEDEFVIHRILSRVKRAVYINNKLYGYRDRYNSIIHMENDAMKKDKLDALQDRAQYYKMNRMEGLCGRALRSYMRESIWKCMGLEESPENKDLIIEQAQSFKLLLRDNRNIGRISRLKYKLFTIFPLQYIALKKSQTDKIHR